MGESMKYEMSKIVKAIRERQKKYIPERSMQYEVICVSIASLIADGYEFLEEESKNKIKLSSHLDLRLMESLEDGGVDTSKETILMMIQDLKNHVKKEGWTKISHIALSQRVDNDRFIFIHELELYGE